EPDSRVEGGQLDEIRRAEGPRFLGGTFLNGLERQDQNRCDQVTHRAIVPFLPLRPGAVVVLTIGEFACVDSAQLCYTVRAEAGVLSPWARRDTWRVSANAWSAR